MKTLRLAVDPDHLETPQARQALNAAAEILRSGGLVALPTETVYGLGANALDAAAVKRIFSAKQRPAWDPVIVHVADETVVETLVAEIPEAARKLMAAFWPGPLALLLPRSSAIPDVVTAGRPLVGLRMPANAVARAAIRLAGIPVAAPSANIFGHVSPTTAAHVLEDLDGRIDAVLDAGPTLHGLESTVLDPCRTPMIIYRPGAITAERIQWVAGAVEIFEEAPSLSAEPKAALPSPGVGLRHYAPRARLLLVDAPPADLPARLAEVAAHWTRQKVGILLPGDLSFDPDGSEIKLGKTSAGKTNGGFDGVVLQPWGRWSHPDEMARDLYAGLRALDDLECDVILCPLPPPSGIGTAIRDRLRKAAFKARD